MDVKNVSNTQEGKIAIDFAQKLVSSDYESAHSMLTDSAKKEWSLESLKTEYIEMIDYFESETPHVNLEDVVETFSDKDAVCIYVSIECDIVGGEAVEVTIDRNKKISSIEWGRP